MNLRSKFIVLMLIIGLQTSVATAADAPKAWQLAWPETDFGRHSIAFSSVLSGGPPKDGIPSIDNPKFVDISKVTHLSDEEPVIVVTRGGESKIYPLQVLMWHEIVNDVVGGEPTVVTYCPLCNAAIVFDARVKGRTLTFGTTGKLRNSDLIMYDRETESWWQQFLGIGVVGDMTDEVLTMLPVRIEAFALAASKLPDAKVLVPPDSRMRQYGKNPYLGYDTSKRPFLYDGDLPKDVPPMMRVVVVDGRAWTLPHLRKQGQIQWQDLILTWSAGQNSALDTQTIAKGRDVGNIVVQRRTDKGLVDAVHHSTFAFVFFAFHPNGKLVLK